VQPVKKARIKESRKTGKYLKLLELCTLFFFLNFSSYKNITLQGRLKKFLLKMERRNRNRTIIFSVREEIISKFI